VAQAEADGAEVGVAFWLREEVGLMMLSISPTSEGFALDRRRLGPARYWGSEPDRNCATCLACSASTLGPALDLNTRCSSY